MTSMKKRITAALMAAALAASLTVSATAAESSSVRVGSYKGRTLNVEERSGLIIGPSGTEYTVSSSNPDVVAVEQVLTFWVAVAKAEGSASLTDNMEIRQEMIRLINQTRKTNGVSDLTVSEALMNAAQSSSDRRYTWHHSKEECQATKDAGYPYDFGDNLTVFTGTANAAQRAVNNRINSPGHFETMINPKCDCIGMGVTQHNGVTCCYMFVGIPDSVNFYA